MNGTTHLGLATLKASDRFVGFRQQTASEPGLVRLTVLCQGPTLLIGADLDGGGGGGGGGTTPSLRAGAPGLAGLTLSDAIPIRSADAAHGPDVAGKFRGGGGGFAAYVGKTIALEIELNGGARAYSVAWR